MPSSKGSSWPRDRTEVSCIGRQVLYLWDAPLIWPEKCLPSAYSPVCNCPIVNMGAVSLGQEGDSTWATGWNPAGPYGGTEASLSPHFFIKEVGFIQPSGPSLSSTRRFRQRLTGEGRARDKGGTGRETAVQPRGRSWFPSGVHITGSLGCFADTESPPGGRS